MGSSEEKRSRMFVLADREHREVKEPGYQTCRMRQDGLLQTLIAISQCDEITNVGICRFDRYFISSGRLLSMEKMEKLLAQYDVVLAQENREQVCTADPGNHVKPAECAKTTECVKTMDPAKAGGGMSSDCMMLIRRKELGRFCKWAVGQQATDDTIMFLLQAFIAQNNLKTGTFHTEIIDTDRMPAMYACIEELTADLIRRYQAGAYLKLPPIDRSVGAGGRMPVFLCWWQGVSDAPPLVQRCTERVRRFFPSDKADVRIITFENYQQYVGFSEVIAERFNSGILSLTHLSDVLRAQLLCRYGGLWIDATYFIWDDRFIDALLQYPYFTQKQGGAENELDIVSGRWANNFMKGPAGFPLFGFMVEAFELYWTKYDKLKNYFLFDYIIAAAYHNIEGIRAIMDACPVNNRASQVLADWGNRPYDAEKMQLLLQDTWLFKMTCKKEFFPVTETGEKTFYGALMEQ